MSEKVIIDTDPGVDDAMAILFACVHREIELVGLTSIFGNVVTDVATRNALWLPELAKRDVPVAPGAQIPLVQTSQPVAGEVHGDNGFGTIPPVNPKAKALHETAAEFICRMINEAPGEITLCPVGPLTNIAAALRLDPSITSKVKKVIVMGGSLKAGGNVTEVAEANVWQDPHAAQEVFSADWPVSMVGLDVTEQVICTPEEFAVMAARAPVLGGFLNEATQFYFDFHKQIDGIHGCYMHDPSAVIAIIRPGFFTSQAVCLGVTLCGEEVGRTFARDQAAGPTVDVCLEVSQDDVREMFLSTISESF